MANEKRLIDANALEFEPDENCIANGVLIWCGRTGGKTMTTVLSALKKMVDNAPTVDAVEVVHGRWEQVQRWATKAKYRCSVCGREIMSATKVNIEKYPYCHCGADMRGDGDG